MYTKIHQKTRSKVDIYEENKLDKEFTEKGQSSAHNKGKKTNWD